MANGRCIGMRIRYDLPRFGLLHSRRRSLLDINLPRGDRQLRKCLAPGTSLRRSPAAGPFSPPEDRPPLLQQLEENQVKMMSPTNKVWSREAGALEKRDLWSSLTRGCRGRCPRCGEGNLFRAFLKVD